MDEDVKFYLCPVCFRVCDSLRTCHEHLTIECQAGRLGTDCRKPLTDQFGQYVSRAPRWYLEACRRIPAWSPFPSS